MIRQRSIEAIAGAAAIALTACSMAPSTMPPAPSSRSSLAPNAARYRSLYAFGQNGKADDGRTPLAGLVSLGGTLYGTTAYGGATVGACSIGCGTLLRISPAGREAVLFRFKGGPADGAIPMAGLLVDGNTLYGTTNAGGGARACSGGCGTVFSSDVQGKTRVLHRFGGRSDGSHPAAGLIALNGVLYGTAMYGGRTSCPLGCGIVFQLNRDGTNEKVIYEFKGGADGAQPTGALIAIGAELYGTTEYGGGRTPFCGTGCGTVFRIKPDGSAEAPIHRFLYGPRNADGAYPAAGLTSLQGVLYGTTSGGGLGGGTVFSLNVSSKKERTLHIFLPNSSDGTHPDARLIVVNGQLYGTTRDGGRAEGTIFAISRLGKERVLYDFGGKPDGAKPAAQLAALAGTLYGTTSSGGATSGGTIFSLSP